METFVSLQTAALACFLVGIANYIVGHAIGRRCRRCAREDRLKAKIAYPFLSE